MIVRVSEPPSRIDACDAVAFGRMAREHVACHHRLVIDCSEVEWISISAMRVLEIASQVVEVTLVNPSPAVHLIAAIFGGDVQCHYDQVQSPAPAPSVPPQRLSSVHRSGKLAS